MSVGFWSELIQVLGSQPAEDRSHKPVDSLPLVARSAVTFPAAAHHRPLVRIKLYCSVARGCDRESNQRPLCFKFDSVWVVPLFSRAWNWPATTRHDKSSLRAVSCVSIAAKLTTFSLPAASPAENSMCGMPLPYRDPVLNSMLNMQRAQRIRAILNFIRHQKVDTKEGLN